jgi:hypothetical protein
MAALQSSGVENGGLITQADPCQDVIRKTVGAVILYVGAQCAISHLDLFWEARRTENKNLRLSTGTAIHTP